MKVKTTAGSGNYHWDYNEFLFLVHALNKTKDFKEVLNLFIDLHSHKEISEIIRRLIIASLIHEGKTYEEIIQLTNASPNTISKIHQKFYRQKSSINQILKRLEPFEMFMSKSHKTRNQLTKFIDKTIYKHSMGLFGKK